MKTCGKIGLHVLFLILLSFSIQATEDPYADEVVSSAFGSGGYGDSTNALGAPDGNAVYLGVSGVIILKFTDNIVADGSGYDITVYTHTGEDSNRVQVEASNDNINYVNLGVTPSGADQASFDLAGSGVSSAKYVRLTDVLASLPSGSDGYNLDAVKAINTQETASLLPDLVISDISISPATPKVNEDITLIAKIKNIGGLTASGFKINIEHGAQYGNSFGVGDTLLPNEYLESKIIVRYNAIGSYNVKFTVDYLNSVEELDENNNGLTKTITVSEKAVCTDSDGGLNYYVKGYVKTDDIYQPITYDACYSEIYPENIESKNTLEERFCDNGQLNTKLYDCPSGCKDGACLKNITICTKDTKVCPDGTVVTRILPNCDFAPCPAAEADLANYPKPFVQYGKINTIIVVGESASSADVISAVDIAASLQNIAGGITMTTKLDREVTTLAQNMISVGSPCINAITAKITGTPNDCALGLKPGQGLIRLYQKEGFTQMIVTGYSDKETRAAAKVIANYKNYQLSGREYIVQTVITKCPSGGYQCDEKGYYVQKCDDNTGQWYNAQYCEKGCENGKCKSYEKCEPKDYQCQDGTYVPWCQCDDYGNTICRTSPEAQCKSCGDNICTSQETSTCANDCDFLGKYLILSDIGNYRFINARYAKQNDYGGMVIYAAEYSAYNNVKLIVAELRDKETAREVFKKELLSQGYSTMELNGNIVYLTNNERMAAWTNNNLIIAVETSGRASERALVQRATQATTATKITGGVIAEAIKPAYEKIEASKTAKLKEIRSRLAEEEVPTKETEMPLEPIRALPKEIIIAYLEIYPSDYRKEPICGNRICEEGEANEPGGCGPNADPGCLGPPAREGTCPKDCIIPRPCLLIEYDPEKEIECLAKGGKWAYGGIVNDCPVPPYCIYEGKDITEVERLAVIMKLEKIKTTINDLKNKAAGLAIYYQEQGDEDKVELWNKVASMFKEIINNINIAERKIKTMETENLKEHVGSIIGEIENSLREIVDVIISSLEKEELSNV